MSYRVTAPLIQARRADGTYTHLYEGAPVPELDEGVLQHLLDSKLIAAESDVTAPPAGNASLDAWQEFARAQGVPAADIDGKTRDELRERFAAK